MNNAQFQENLSEEDSLIKEEHANSKKMNNNNKKSNLRERQKGVTRMGREPARGIQILLVADKQSLNRT